MSSKTEITIKSDRYRISGYVGHREVMSLSLMMGEWVVGSSSCLPVNIDMARLYVECMQRVFSKAHDSKAHEE